MKKTLVFIAALILIILGGLCWIWYFPEDSAIVEKNGLTYYHEKNTGLTVVLFDEPIAFYLQSDLTQTLAEASQIHHYRVAINGSYFTPEYDHAGLLFQNNTTTVPLAKLDHQLNAVVLLSTSSMRFVSVKDFVPEMLSSSTVAFQTGPLVINKNIIASEAIADSLNGEGEYLRTLLGVTESGQYFFVIISTKTTLPNLAKHLLSLKLFANDTISAVNLDGGPSTALFAAEMPELNFREAKYLPIILGIN